VRFKWLRECGFSSPAASPARFSFLVHPSRVPVNTANAINATALVFDRFENTVLEPSSVAFRFSPGVGEPFNRRVPTELGIAWLQMGSTSDRSLRVLASVGESAETRVIQQVASEACAFACKPRPASKRETAN